MQQGGEALERVIERVNSQYPDADVSIVRKAAEYAMAMHEGQMRSSGDPYITHPLEVVNILLDLEVDIPTIAAALLHDVVEDTEATYEDIQREFSTEIAELVDGVTKLTRMSCNSREEQQAESLRKMMLATARDVRVIMIKLCDRLHNMRTLQFRPQDRQQAKAKETLEIYAPIAHRLGISRIKVELEDLALQYLDPEAYKRLADNVSLMYTSRLDAIQHAMAEIRQKLAEHNIAGDVSGRSKHYYSIYKKMQRQGKNIDEVFDLVAVRVIVHSEQDCYAVLGMVHTIWRPIPGRFKDYIANPKPNMYQSLHTTVIGHTGNPFEIQIRTYEMHRTAEYGIAAHWMYKEGKTVQTAADQKMGWLRRILEWQNEDVDAQEFVDSMKIDLFNDEVFVFTPKGDVVNLPLGSTPVDFAFHIHSAVGNRCVGAKLNNRIVPLDTKLQTGDIVEIMTNPNSKGPSLDWLKFVFTSQARTKIRAWLKKEYKEDNIIRGKDMLDKEARRLGAPLNRLMREEWLEPIYQRYSLRTPEDIYAAVGYGGLNTSQVLTRLLEEYRSEQRRELLERSKQEQENAITPEERTASAEKARLGQSVIVMGEKNMLVRFANCCNPIPGDEIVGYITRGRGVSIHRADCVNLADLSDLAARTVEAQWASDSAESSFQTALSIYCKDRPGILASIINKMAEMNVELVGINARVEEDGVSHIACTLHVEGQQQLDKIMRTLSRMPEITKVRRGNT